VFEPGRRRRGTCRNPGRNVPLPLQCWLLCRVAAGIPWRLAKRMAECLARFAIRVSSGPGCGSAVKLQGISPIPISTTPDATIVQTIRDRIRFSFAAVHQPRCSPVFSATQRPKSKYKPLKELEGPKPVGCGVRVDCYRARVNVIDGGSRKPP